MTGRWTGRAGFTLDLDRCVGCAACVVACRLENGWSKTGAWRRVVALNIRRRPAGPTYYLSLACHHCERPACLAACPSGAFEKLSDGRVVHDADLCLGCQYCQMACPFEVPQYDDAAGVIGKCHHCRHRIDRGELPACVVACPTGALEARPEDAESDGLPEIPGFADVGGCQPAIRFRAPRGRRRAHLLDTLERAIRKAAEPRKGRG